MSIYLIDGKPYRPCECPERSGECPRGIKRQLMTTSLTRCIVPAANATEFETATIPVMHGDVLTEIEVPILQARVSTFEEAAQMCDREAAEIEAKDGPHEPRAMSQRGMARAFRERAKSALVGDREDNSLAEIPMGPVGATYGWPGQDEDKRDVEPDEERAWLIEFVEARWGTGYFWIGVSEFNEWGTIDKAVRFAREEDANRVIESLKKRDSHITGMHYEAHEHSWLAARAKGGSK